jgi:hypothetical protein
MPDDFTRQRENLQRTNVKWKHSKMAGTFCWGQTTLKLLLMGDSSYRLNFDQGKKNEIQHHS